MLYINFSLCVKIHYFRNKCLVLSVYIFGLISNFTIIIVIVLPRYNANKISTSYKYM